jgi:type VI secretion system protein ImpH
MAGEVRAEAHPVDGSKPSALMEALRARPFDFDFFQAVRRLENAAAPGPRMGYSKRPADDPVRFCQEVSLTFAPATIAGLRPADEVRPVRMFVSFMGLCGPHGPMPMHITEYVRQRERNYGDPSPARFFDIFNHRMISLFYRAWAVNQQAVSYDRYAAQDPARSGEQDRFAAYVASLFGMGMGALRNRDSVPDVAKLHYSGRLSAQTRCAEGIEAVLADYFKVPAQIIQFVGQWLRLPADNLCRLGRSRDTGLLGATAIVGSRVWDASQKFRIRMGPMSLGQYQGLLPGGARLAQLADWVMNYTGRELAWDLQLVLAAAEVPQVRLGRSGRLGWTTWLNTRPAARDADDLKVRPAA